jgi:tRNA A-37 threonylcarbamoyl transferase component Bud32/tetratricopeptide (TPR) repeat protein
MHDRVSHYRVLHPLGEGGMGEVFAGLDETLKRRVALKAIRADHRLNPEAKARFLREARILSQLDHPHICRVFDYIEDADNDWLVLELIEGKSLRTALAHALHPRVKLRIAEQIASVLVVTHASGIVHRDLKPGNVMLTRDNEVKVLDFGLASSGTLKARDELRQLSPSPDLAGSTEGPDVAGRDLTRTSSSPAAASGLIPREEFSRFETSRGSVMGTLAYMSPEQSRGEAATPASDMFSFGLVLQELFTGRHPYPLDLDSSTLIERVRSGLTDPPAGVPADLAGLMKRLTAPAPAERPTATQAAERLQWIREKPRRRLRAGLAAAVLTLAALGAAKYVADLGRERTLALAARDDANRRREQAEGLIGFMLGDLRKKLEPVGRLEILNDVGNRAMDYFAAVPESTLSETELLRRSTALYQIGTVRIAQGQLEEATKPLEASRALAAALVLRKPNDPERLYELGQSEFWVGYVLWRRRHLDEALVRFNAYVDISEKLVASAPQNSDYQLELSSANSNIASVLQERGDLPGALERFKASLRIDQSLLEKTPDDNKLRWTVAVSNNSIGVVLKAQGKLADALAHHQAELSLSEELVRSQPDNAQWREHLSVAHNYVGGILEARGQMPDARAHYEQAIAICQALVTRDAANMDWRRELGRNHYRLGRNFLAAGARPAALRELGQAVSVSDRVAATDRTNTGWQRDLGEARHALGEAKLQSGDVAGAALESEQTQQLAAAALKRSSDDRLAMRLRALGLLLAGDVARAQGHATRAAGAYGEALSIIEPLARDSNDDRLLQPLAAALERLGRIDDQRAVIRRLEAMGYRTPVSAPRTGVPGLRQPVAVR